MKSDRVYSDNNISNDNNSNSNNNNNDWLLHHITTTLTLQYKQAEPTTATSTSSYMIGSAKLSLKEALHPSRWPLEIHDTRACSSIMLFWIGVPDKINRWRAVTIITIIAEKHDNDDDDDDLYDV